MKKSDKEKLMLKLSVYQNLYPMNLYVCSFKDINEIVPFFNFYRYTKDLRDNDPAELIIAKNISAATYLVREKEADAVGVLIVLDDFSCSTLAHESIHYADAVYDYLHMNGEGYDEGNEQYAYLVTWCVEALENFLQSKHKQKKTK